MITRHGKNFLQNFLTIFLRTTHTRLVMCTVRRIETACIHMGTPQHNWCITVKNDVLFVLQSLFDRLMDLTVIIPTYNRANLLRQAVDSAIEDLTSHATGIRYEIIIVDDGSSDTTEAVLKRYTPPIKVIKQAHKGANSARNQGLWKASGKYIRFVDSDDRLAPGITERQMKILERSKADVCYGDWLDTFSDSSGITSTATSVQSMGPVTDPVEALLGDRWCAPFCYLLSRKSACDIQGWDESLEGCQDLDFILRIALSGYQFQHVPVLAGYYHHHAGHRISRNSKIIWCNAKKKIFLKAITTLTDNSNWTQGRREAIAASLLRLAKIFFGVDRGQFHECIKQLNNITPQFKPPGLLYRSMVGFFGFEVTESILEIRRKHFLRQRRVVDRYR